MKRIALLTLIICFTYALKAQDYYHAVGLKINYGIFTYKYNIGGFQEKTVDGGMVPGVFYKAMMAFEIDRNSMFAIAAYPYLGMSGVIGSRGSSSDAGLAFELPVVGEYMMGDPDDTHFYANVGLSFLAMATSGGSGTIFGPRVGAGGQFEIQDQLIGIKAALLYGINSNNDLDSSWENVKQSRIGFSIGLYYSL
jgi:hypothetical protein